MPDSNVTEADGHDEMPSYDGEFWITVYFANSLEFGEDRRRFSAPKSLLSESSDCFSNAIKASIGGVITFDMIFPGQTDKETMWECLKWFAGWRRTDRSPFLLGAAYIWEFCQRIGYPRLQNLIVNDFCKSLSEARDNNIVWNFSRKEVQWLLDRAEEDFEACEDHQLIRFYIDYLVYQGPSHPAFSAIHTAGGPLSCLLATVTALMRPVLMPSGRVSRYDPLNMRNRQIYLVTKNTEHEGLDESVNESKENEPAENEDEDSEPDSELDVDLCSLEATGGTLSPAMYLDRESTARIYRLGGLQEED